MISDAAEHPGYADAAREEVDGSFSAWPGGSLGSLEVSQSLPAW